MTILLRATQGMLDGVRKDLERPHPFAAERVGFLFCRAGKLSGDGLIVLIAAYQAVADEDYIEDMSVGAQMGPAAIRKALQFAYNKGAQDFGIFHVHMHEHHGRPDFSGVDVSENRKFIPDFFHAIPAMPHGAIVLSRDEATAACWIRQNEKEAVVTQISCVGAPLKKWGRQ